MRKKLGTAFLVLALSCGVAAADNLTPSRNVSKPSVTFVEKIQQAWNHLFAWF